MDFWEDDNEDIQDDAVRDFAYGGKDATIYLIDSSKEMHIKREKDQAEDVDGNNLSPFRKALKAVCNSMKKTVFSSPNDLIGIVIYGTEKTVDVPDFQHLSMVVPLQAPVAASILKLEELYEEESTAQMEFRDMFGGPSEDYSLHEALWHCQTLFAGASGKIGKKRILLMTCQDNPHQGDKQKQRQCLQKAKDLKDNNIFLEILPIESNNGFNMDLYFKDFDFYEGEGGYEVPHPSERWQDLERVIRKKIHKKRSIGKMFLDLGNGVKLSVANYNFIQKSYKPSKVRLAKDTNDEVKTQRNFINYSTGAPLLPSDMNKYQEYGGKRIKFSMDETKNVAMLDGQLGLKLCGFKPLKTLKWGHFVRSGNFLYPEEKLMKGSRTLFAALLIKCLERNVYAVCSFKARDNSGPSFVALIPQEESRDQFGQKLQPSGFQVVYLPFADDIRHVPRADFCQPNQEQINAAKGLIKAARVASFDPNNFNNPDVQSHFTMIESLALQRDQMSTVQEDAMVAIDDMAEWLAKKDSAKVFVENVYPEGYNPDVSAPKRKAQAVKKEPVAKKSKTDDEALNMDDYVNQKKVEKLTVAQIKEYFQSKGIKPAGKKKAELVEEVYDLYK